MSHGVIPDRAARGARGSLAPLARLLGGVGVTANAVTVAGLLVTLAGATMLALDRPLPALILLTVGSLADTLDGALARATGGGTPFGAFLDSTTDRLADAALFCGAVAVAALRGDALLLSASLAALVASAQVSYVRAKAEAIGQSVTVGPAPREARLALLLAGLGAWALFGLSEVFTAAVAAVAVLSTITFIQRIALVARRLRDKGDR